MLRNNFFRQTLYDDEESLEKLSTGMIPENNVKSAGNLYCLKESQ